MGVVEEEEKLVVGRIEELRSARERVFGVCGV